MKRADAETFQYKSIDAEWLVPVYRSEPDPEKLGDYPPLDVVGLASISNPSESLEHLFFVSNS